MLIRDSRFADVDSITAVYARQVLTGLATFEETPPDAAEMERRRREVLERGLPWLVAEVAGEVAGYAYAAPYRLRSAYRFTVEDSIYVAEGHRGGGVGRALLAALVERSTAAGCRQMVAVIGDSANAASIGLHAALGFRETGVLRSVGFKFGRWVDCVLMQRALGRGDGAPPGP